MISHALHNARAIVYCVLINDEHTKKKKNRFREGGKANNWRPADIVAVCFSNFTLSEQRTYALVSFLAQRVRYPNTNGKNCAII